MVEAQEISVRILHDELAGADLGVVAAIPAFLYGQEDGKTRIDDGRVKGVRVLDADLEVDAAPERRLEWRRREHPGPKLKLLEHQLRAASVQKRETLLGPIVQNAKVEEADVKGEAPL